jgi:hypothetical protein
MTLEDSTTYQLILRRGEARGEARGEKGAILRLGEKRFGPAPVATLAALEGMTDRAELARVLDRLFDATGWDDLLAQN